jgi:O-antigen/teichoic acid export membrane protein
MFASAISKIRGTVFFRGGIAALDQGMLSVINLGVQILLIKTVAKSDFGYYSIALSVIMYLMSFQNAVVNTPITVSIASKTKEAKNLYVSSIFSGQLLSLGIISIVGLIVVSLLYLLGLSAEESFIAASLSLASFGILNREFLRSYFFAEEEPLRVLKLDFYYGIIYAVLIAISYVVFKISVPLIILFMGVASGFDSLILNKRFKFNFQFAHIKSAFLENWLISKWSLIGVTVTHLQNYAYLYVISTLLGSAATADVSASRLLLMPLGLITIGWGNVIRPYGSKLREQKQLKKFFKNLAISGLVFPLVVLIVTLIFFIFSDWFLHNLFTSDYKSVFDYLFYWATLTSIGFLRANASYGLQVVKKFKSLALFNAVTMLITVTLAFVLTNQFEIEGALMASITGELIFACILWYNLFKSIYK